MRGGIVLMMLLALGACAPAPRFVRNPESGIELRWPSAADDLALARADASAACGGEEAMLRGLTMDQDVTLAQFACR